MRSLLVSDKLQTGEDPAVGQVAKILTDRFGFNDMAIHTTDEAVELSEEFSNIILWDALPWFLQNRTAVLGRPWVVSLNFTFHSLIRFLHIKDAPEPPVSPSDCGIHALVTNIDILVEQTAIVMPSLHSFRPYPEELTEYSKDRPIKLGTVLPNLLDRDLCLLDDIAKLNPSRSDFRIFRRPGDKQRLPDNLQQYEEVYESELQAYKQIRHYVIAPRLLVYRSRVLCPDLARACGAGCKPLVIWHPSLQAVSKLVRPTYQSLGDFREAVNQVLAGEDLNITVNPGERQLMCPAPYALARALALIRGRWIANDKAQS